MSKQQQNSGRKKKPIARKLSPAQRKTAKQLRELMQRGDAPRVAKACGVNLDTVYYWLSTGKVRQIYVPVIAKTLGVAASKFIAK